MVADIQSDKLPPDHIAHLHLLAFYKEARQLDKAYNFWEWLENQDNEYVNPAVYGAAIELLAVQGRPAEETEGLYIQALKRFPGSFNEYHLSPDAVLPDRGQPFNIRGIPVTLLQGMLTARLLRGDSKNAYIALDVALRLFPTQLPSRFFTLFVDERPLTEAYKVFIMACRSGTTLGPDCLKALLAKMRPVAVTDPLANAAVTRSMLTACYAFAASGNSLTPNHLTELVIAVTSVLQHSSLQHLEKDVMHQLTHPILLVVAKLFAIWASQNARPGIAAFNSIISNVAGKGSREDVLATCLADMQELGLEPTAVTRRSILKAAGDIGDSHLVKDAWDRLVDYRQSIGARADLGDWQTLARAARQVREQDYVRQQLLELGDGMQPAMVARIEGLLQETVEKATTGSETSSPEHVVKMVDQLLKDAEYMDDQLLQNRFRDFHINPVPTSIAHAEHIETGPDQLLRGIYDELTADKSFTPAENDQPDEHFSEVIEENMPSSSETVTEVLSVEAATEASSAVSTTGIDYAELRYQNWKTINELLAEAEQNDSDYLAAVDAAIQQGTLPPKRDNGWKRPATTSRSVGLADLDSFKADAHSDGAVNSTENDNDDDVRQRILRLRGRLE
ncbi:hypothetical protein BDV97DRAFT_287021 [Delphinella strobiligena]|nr:hypothetical protein BDV97DRAFT_287021 [Delphinella strobiligena]